MGERGRTNLLRGSDLSSSDSPNGLVSNHDVLPVLLVDDLGEGLSLTGDDLLGLVGLALLERLTNAEDDLDASGEGSLGL